jgi:hypothetical protein
MDPRRAELEERATALCGERITQVRYLEIAYENGQTGWDHYGDRFHTLDYGLELEMESGRVYSLVWDWEFAEYGITVQPGSSQDDIQNCAVRDMTTDPAWVGLLHRPITAVEVYWGEWEETGGEGFTRQEIEAALRTTRGAKPADRAAGGFGLQDLLAVMETLGATRPKGPIKHVHYPQDIVITVESDEKIYLCARQYREEQDELFPSSDEITVIFREDLARHYHVGPHTRP